MNIKLPYPPSANKYYRNVGNKTLISSAGRDYRKRVNAVVTECMLRTGQRTYKGRLSVYLGMVAPDRRRRDIDNIQKPLLDALQHARVFEDDEHIDLLITERLAADKETAGVVCVVEPMKGSA